MEVLQTILMVIGAITTIWFVYKIVKGIPIVLGNILEAGFRDRFPFDFKMHLGWIISEMKSKGYEQAGVMDAGSENPGVLMKNKETGNEMEIRLRAPLSADKAYSIIVSNHDNNTSIVMQDNTSEDNKKLLEKYLDLTILKN